METGDHVADRAKQGNSVASSQLAQLPAGHPWLDPQRFGQRRHLLAIDRQHRPQLAAPDTSLWRHLSLARQWAGLLRCADGPIDPLDLLICPSLGDVLRAGLALLLYPGAIVLLAEPVAPEVLRIIAQADAQWIDVGRTAAGDIDELALQRAALAHPGAIFYAEVPQLLGQIEPPLERLPDLRASVLDLRYHAWPTQIPKATAVLLALRDADQPREPVLYALATAAGLGQGVALLLGDPQLPEAVSERARAVLLNFRDFPLWAQSAQEAVAARARQLSGAAAGWIGLVDGGQRGLRWAAQCQAGDADALLQHQLGLRLGLAAYCGHPMHNLLIADLTAPDLGPAEAAPTLPQV